MRLSLALALSLAAADASAGPFHRMLMNQRAREARAAAAAEAEAVEAPQAAALPAAAAAEVPLSFGEVPVPPLDPRGAFYPSEVKRNELLQKAAGAGVRGILKDAGLALWRFDASSSLGEEYRLTVSPFDGASYPAAKALVAEKGPEVQRRVGEALGVDAGAIKLLARPLDSCCGAGCASCLRSKDDASQYWTGRPPRRNEK